MTEAQFTNAVLGLMRVLGWRSMHVRPARTAAGSWRTPVAGDGIGWPDVVAVKADRAIAAELKVAGGRLGPGQREWLAALALAGCEVYVWTPKSWREIEDVLKGQFELTTNREEQYQYEQVPRDGGARSPAADPHRRL